MSNRLPAYGADALQFKVEFASPEVMTVDCENMELAQKRKLIALLDRIPHLDRTKNNFDVLDPWLLRFYLQPDLSGDQVLDVAGCVKAAIWFTCLLPQPQHAAQ